MTQDGKEIRGWVHDDNLVRKPKSAFTQLTVPGPRKAERIREEFGAMDTNGDERLSLQEFVAGTRKPTLDQLNRSLREFVEANPKIKADLEHFRRRRQIRGDSMANDLKLAGHIWRSGAWKEEPTFEQVHVIAMDFRVTDDVRKSPLHSPATAVKLFGGETLAARATKSRSLFHWADLDDDGVLSRDEFEQAQILPVSKPEERPAANGRRSATNRHEPSAADTETELDTSRFAEALRDTSAATRASAARALLEMGAKAVPILTEALQDKNSDVRARAAQTLASMSYKTKARFEAAVPALIRALEDENDSVRASAAQALSNTPPRQMKSALSSFTGGLRDRHSAVRSYCAKALGNLGAEAGPAVPILAELLRDDDKYVRQSAAEALGKIGPRAESAIPSLLGALRDDEKHVRSAAATTLAGMKGHATDVLPALIGALRDEDDFVRRRVAQALGEMGADAEPAVPALIEALRDDKWIVRTNAARALGQLGPAAAEAVPALIDALNDENRSMRRYATQALGNIGLKAKDAVPALTKLLDDTSLKWEAEMALRKIGAEP
jgi:HEAT repeat protein